MKLDPPPPPDVLWIRPVSGKIPVRTAGGKLWDDVGGWPDGYVIIKLGDRELMRTSAAVDTVEPKWSDAGANFAVPPGAELTIELREADTVEDPLIGTAHMAPPTAEQLAAGSVDLPMRRRASVRLAVEPAHASIGLGFDYLFFKQACVVRQVLAHGPASRAGMRVGDKLVSIGGRRVKTMHAKELRSALNSVPASGVDLVVLHDGGTSQTVTLAEGPVYPLHGELGEKD